MAIGQATISWFLWYFYINHAYGQQNRFYPHENQFRFRYTWKIHENKFRKTNAKLIGFIHSKVIFSSHSPYSPNGNRETLVTYWIYILVVADFADLKSVRNMTSHFMCVYCIYACVHFDMDVMCDVYRTVSLHLSSWIFLAKRCFEDVMERNEANVPHYWYWYGINWAKLTSRRPICSALLVECQQMWPNIQLLRITWDSFWPQNRNSVINKLRENTTTITPKQSDRLNSSLTLLTTHLSYSTHSAFHREDFIFNFFGVDTIFWHIYVFVCGFYLEKVLRTRPFVLDVFLWECHEGSGLRSFILTTLEIFGKMLCP